MELYGKYIESRRNHERRVSASGTAGAKREENELSLLNIVLFLFCIAIGNACAHLAEDSKEKTQYSEAAASIPPSK